MSFARGTVLCLWLIAVLAACATPPTDPIDRAAFEQRNDPLEPLNRHILDANQVLDRILLRLSPRPMFSPLQKMRARQSGTCSRI